MSLITKEQIEQAKAWDLLSYLQAHDPHELKRCGPHEYCTRTPPPQKRTASQPPKPFVLPEASRFPCLRETRDNFKVDVEGSDKRYSFVLSAADPDCPRLAVAESPIDALSVATLVKLSRGDWRDSHYLSLGGTAPRAMLQFLHDHPHVTQVSLCLDNDDAGMKGMERLEQAIQEDVELSRRVTLVCRNPPPTEYGKDYNEFLCAQVAAMRSRCHQQSRGR